MPGRLSGKVCIVTGTGGSMGRATALTFAREGALVVGCDVAVESAEETLELVEAAGGEMASLQPCVVSDPAECARLVDLAVSRFGRIDVLFNLAGRSHFGRVAEEAGLERHHLAAGCFDQLDCFFRRLDRQVAADDQRTFAGEHQGGRASHASGRAADDADLA